MQFAGRGILLDIEGTTSSVSFVYDVMFPYVRRNLEAYLTQHWESERLVDACETIARDAGKQSLASWIAESGTAKDGQQLVRDEVVRLMDGDVKATGLKELQGLIWEDGFASGELKSHIYDDLVPALKAWNGVGIDVRIYSSGSIHAQRLFFSHTKSGDLLGHFRGHYDTTIGGKKETASYIAIAKQFGLPPADILFCSDIVAELDAARSAGMRTALVVRPGNAPQPENNHPQIKSFAEIEILSC